MFPFCGTILLMSMRARDLMRDTNFGKEKKLVSHTHHPNHSEQRGFSFQRGAQQGPEIHETFKSLQI
jgi:hypothetical protein